MNSPRPWSVSWPMRAESVFLEVEEALLVVLNVHDVFTSLIR